ncbi:hypothetical protein CCB80_03965 [Armatimonadetes bacterium Uphvl-Ar1]|nr:hypothetical protein CCB80_03965 [Armatimonadetes bacterium Uphvl-Ar1]
MITTALAASLINRTTSNQEALLQAAWAELKPVHRTSPFLTNPNIALRQPGELNQDFVKDAHNFLKFVRITAQLDSNLTIEDNLSFKAQWGAHLLQSNNSVGHRLPMPSNFHIDDYATASQGTVQSNITRLSGRRTNLVEMIHLQMVDDKANVWNVGHRRWFLNPRLQKIGYGFVQSGQVPTSYGAIMASDQSALNAKNPPFVAWPAPEAFPIEFCPPSIPWSVSLNPKNFAKPNPDLITIELKDHSTNKIWIFHPDDNRNKRTDTDFFANFCGRKFGNGPAFTFRPTGINYAPNTTYSVRITGLKTAQGEATEINYQTKLFRLNHPVILHAHPQERTPNPRT